MSISAMASNNAPLTELEKAQLRNQSNIDFIMIWANRLGITEHPEVREEIRMRRQQVIL